MLEIFTMGDLRWSLCGGESGWFHGSTICTHGVFRRKLTSTPSVCVSDWCHLKRWPRPIIFILYVKNLCGSKVVILPKVTELANQSFLTLIQCSFFISQPLSRKVLDFWRGLDLEKGRVLWLHQAWQTLGPLFPGRDLHLHLHFSQWFVALDAAAELWLVSSAAGTTLDLYARVRFNSSLNNKYSSQASYAPSSLPDPVHCIISLSPPTPDED